MRGDNNQLPIAAALIVGTPPRAWGQLNQLHDQYVGFRNTPTCVGTTHSHRLSAHAPKEHPHVRGDNAIVEATIDQGEGTPPRAWGQPVGVWCHLVDVRNTPTCVGTTLAGVRAGGETQEHPHVRGDNIIALAKGLTDSRNTPTCVGTTKERKKYQHLPTGTPPRAWGQRYPCPSAKTCR